MKLKGVGQVIATRVLDLTAGHRIKGKVIVKMGKPKPFPRSPSYYCPYEVDGLGSKRVSYIIGEDAFQAMQLTMKAIGAELYLLNKRQRGGRLRWEGDYEGDLGFPLPWPTPVRRGGYGHWSEVTFSVAELMKKREYGAATKAIDSFLACNPRRPLRCQAFAFQSILRERMGQLGRAKQDLLKAHSLSRPGSFGRYGCELGLGQVCEKQGRIEEAKRWYWRGLATCMKAKEIISAGAGLNGLLQLGVEAKLTSKDRLLLRRAILRSWKQMCVPGRPDFKNLSGIADALNKASRGVSEKAKR